MVNERNLQKLLVLSTFFNETLTNWGVLGLKGFRGSGSITKFSALTLNP
jgi:hypothetical protein